MRLTKITPDFFSNIGHYFAGAMCGIKVASWRFSFEKGFEIDVKSVLIISSGRIAYLLVQRIK